MTSFLFVPAPLRKAWSNDPLPVRIAYDLKLSEGATYQTVTAEKADGLNQNNATRLERHLVKRIKERFSEIAELTIIDRSAVLTESLPDFIPWRRIDPMVRRALKESGYYDEEPERIVGLTFGELSRVDCLGAARILQLTCWIERFLTVGEADTIKELEKEIQISDSNDLFRRESAYLQSTNWLCEECGWEAEKKDGETWITAYKIGTNPDDLKGYCPVCAVKQVAGLDGDSEANERCRQFYASLKNREEYRDWYLSENPQLSLRSINSLNKAGVMCLSDLVQLTKDELHSIKNLGSKSFKEIEDFLNELGLSLGQMVRFNQTGEFELVEPSVSSEERAFLFNILEKDWSDMISKEDPRFSELPALPAGEGTVHQQIRDVLGLDGQGAVKAARAKMLVQALQGVSEEVKRIREMTLEEQLRDLIEKSASGKQWSSERTLGICAHLGWNEADPVTLEEVGSNFGVSRERIRQLRNAILEKFPGHEVYLPRLDQAISVLEEAMPISFSDAMSLLQREGICEKPISVPGLINAIEVSNRDHEYDWRDGSKQLSKTAKRKILQKSADTQVANQVAVIAIHQAAFSGASHVQNVLEGMEIVHPGEERSAEWISRVLKADQRFEFLDHEWYCNKSYKSQIYKSLAQKILAAADRPVDLRLIREGIARHLRFRINSEKLKRHGQEAEIFIVDPDLDILRKWFERSKEFSVSEDDFVESNESLSRKKVLSEIELEVVKIFEEDSDGVLSREDTLSFGKDRDVNSSTLSIYLTFNPISQSFGSGLWGLRGSQVDPGIIATVSEDVRRRRSQNIRGGYKHTGWTEDGCFLLVKQLTSDFQTTITGPEEIEVELKWTVKSDLFDCTGCPPIKKYGSMARSLAVNQVIQRGGFGKGDFLSLKFDVHKMEVFVSKLSAEEFLELE
tara:strand:+ start:139 stop:2874 length:2736 start_codon:yes stop_codon:yes gene_type:complete